MRSLLIFFFLMVDLDDLSGNWALYHPCNPLHANCSKRILQAGFVSSSLKHFIVFCDVYEILYWKTGFGNASKNIWLLEKGLGFTAEKAYVHSIYSKTSRAWMPNELSEWKQFVVCLLRVSVFYLYLRKEHHSAVFFHLVTVPLKPLIPFWQRLQLIYSCFVLFSKLAHKVGGKQ